MIGNYFQLIGILIGLMCIIRGEGLTYSRMDIMRFRNFENAKSNLDISATYLQGIKSNLDILGLNRKKKHKKIRKGRAKLSICFLNAHGKKSLERQNMNPIANHSILFLSETWQMQQSDSVLFDNRYREVVYAKKGKYGRPFGGLELYAAKHLAPQTVSKTNSHIAIRFGKYVVIGVYYQGTMDFGDITTDLMSVIIN